MSCTLPSGSRKTWTSPSAEAVIRLALLLPGLPLAGCAAGGELHPDYAALMPRVVHVPPVKNETLLQLDQVSFGGLLQRAVIGAETYNVPELLRGSLEEVLLRKGYDLESPGGAPATPAAPAASATLQATIEAWESETTGRFGMYLRYRLEMVRTPTGERLYAGTFACQEHPDARSSGADELIPTLRRSAARSLAGLPGHVP